MFTALVLALVMGRVMLIRIERVKRDAEVREAYQEYRQCLLMDIFCVPAHPCPGFNRLGDFLSLSEGINRRHWLLSTIEGRSLLSGWQPRWYPPAP